MRAVKGHGTGNDFVVLPDLDGEVELTADLARALCDRHRGIGADGVLRVVRSAAMPEAAGQADRAEFFMDYRNADGSLAEMCGNGVRVFAQYLRCAGLAGDELAVATRAGVLPVRLLCDGRISVAMGRPTVEGRTSTVTVRDAAPMAGQWVAMPNPHVVVELAVGAELAGLDLVRPPTVDPSGRHGQNVEFAVRTGPSTIRMRVHERGVGETQSCGTGVCAVVAALADPGSGPWQVSVPGGTCTVDRSADGALCLTGPAVLVGTVELSDAWLAAATN